MNEEQVRILLVDDHAMLRQGLRSLIGSQEGLAIVGEASSMQAALEKVRALSPHVVIMDIHLAAENGIEVSRQILVEFPSIKIVVLSGDPDLALVTQALQAGVSAYVLKDNELPELIRAIHAVMDHQTYLSQEVASVVVTDYLRAMEGRTIPATKPILTDRERHLLKLVAGGARNKEIAEALSVGVKSVETYRSRLMKKLGCTSANELTRYAIREGIVSP
jgi:two-component system, NarL family, response regulator NreC